jgi:hypothetical protein
MAPGVIRLTIVKNACWARLSIGHRCPFLRQQRALRLNPARLFDHFIIGAAEQRKRD